MSFKSKAQMEKMAQLVKEGKLSQAKFDEWLRATINPNLLPDRLPQKPDVKWPKTRLRKYR